MKFKKAEINDNNWQKQSSDLFDINWIKTTTYTLMMGIYYEKKVHTHIHTLWNHKETVLGDEGCQWEREG